MELSHQKWFSYCVVVFVFSLTFFLTNGPSGWVWIVPVGLIFFILGSAKKAILPAISLLACFLLWSLVSRFSVSLIMQYWPGVPPSIQQAVGSSAYTGFPKSSENLSFYVSFILAGLLGLAFSMLVKKPKDMLLAKQLDNQQGILRFWFPMLLSIFIGILFFPQFAGTVKNLAQTKHNLGWDDNNNRTWQYMFSSGWLPFRDYWYPYAGQFNQIVPFVFPMLRAFVHLFILYSLFIFAIYNLVKQSKIWTLLILIALLYLKQDYIAQINRYLLPIILLFVFAILIKNERKFWLKGIVFGLILFWIANYEPNQIVNAFPALLVYFILQYTLQRQYFNLPVFIKFLCVAFVAFIVPYGFYLLNLYHHGQLLGYYQFYFYHIGAMLSYCSMPANIGSWSQFILRAENITFMLPCFILMAAIMMFRASPDKDSRDLAILIIAAAFISAVLFVKQLMRPHIANAIVTASVMSIILFCYWLFQQGSRYQKAIAISYFFAILAGVTYYHPNEVVPFTNLYVRSANDFFKEFHNNLNVLLADQSTFQKSYDYYFARESFECNDCKPIINELDQLRKSQKLSTMYVFGDQSYFYILMQQKPPFYITFYDDSPLKAQATTVAWLEEKKPEFVVWNPKLYDHDKVPHIVRDPLLFTYMTYHYIPYRQHGVYWLLKRREDNQKTDFNFWIKQIGNVIDFKALPAFSSIANFKACQSNQDPNCKKYIEIAIDGMPTTKSHTIQLTAAGKPFQIKFQEVSGHNRYFIDPERIWFWNFAKSENMPIKINKNIDDTSKLNIIYKEGQPNILY